MEFRRLETKFMKRIEQRTWFGSHDMDHAGSAIFADTKFHVKESHGNVFLSMKRNCLTTPMKITQAIDAHVVNSVPVCSSAWLCGC